MLDAMMQQQPDAASQQAAALNQAAQQMREQGSQQQPAHKPSWRDALPDDIKGDEGLAKFDNVANDNERLAAISRSYVSAQKMIGADKLVKPKGPDDKEAMDAVYAALGRPEKADDYKVTRPAEIPQGINIDEAGEKTLKEFAHANGWNQRQFDNAYKAFFERERASIEERVRLSQSSYEDCQRALQSTGNAPEIMNQASVMIRNYGDPQVIAKLKAAGLDNDPVIVQFLARAGKDLIGHSVLKKSDGSTMASTESIDAQIAKLRQEQNDALYQAGHPNHAQAVAQLNRLYEERAKAKQGAAA